MPRLNHKGPESKGPKTGRKLGLCKTSSDEKEFELGQGMGKSRKSDKCEGQGKRLKSSKIIE